MMCNFLIGLFLFGATQVLNAEVTFPQIEVWKKSPLIELESKKTAILVKNGQIKNAFSVVTTNDDELTLKFSGGEVITVLPRTKILVPQVSPDDGDSNEFFIDDGTIRYKAGTALSKLRLKSGFFDLKIPVGIDAFISINKKAPSSEFRIIAGEMTVQFLDFEKVQELKAGDQILFAGEFDDKGQIKYDFLLNNRKAPHGKLESIKKFDFAAYVKAENAKEEVIRQQLEKKKQAELANKKKQFEFEKSFLCRNPFGHRDECYWKKIEDLCYRFRCNANGDWGDKTERPVDEKCQAKAQVGRCDY